ncbi:MULTISPECIES: BA14K family protein [unclassified Roseitalea]|uniref:BA14K family protein n=1 Tax=unclassified Roseitalea TaxID=2639107 RepID=UPI00273EC68A|nr:MULTISPECIES: BA14K family protein [unclassified Roseitalea]
MRRILGLATALAVAAAFATATPAEAAATSFKLPAAAAEAGVSDIVKAGHRGHVSVRIHWRGGHIYLNGHRGYKYKRSGYRHYKGYWYPPRAFVVIGPDHRRHVYVRRYHRPHKVRPRIIDLNRAHYRWCDAKYRSYRASDNSFQPYHGPRKPCISPYWR